MAHPSFNAVDVVQELRLRRWARENYVPASERSASWHPIVLDEMAAKDAEAADPSPGAPYVPLIPAPLHLFHQSHGMAPQAPPGRHQDCELYFHG